MNCGNFQNFSKYAVDGDPNAHKFTHRQRLQGPRPTTTGSPTRHQAATLMSDGALQTLKLGMAMGFGDRYVPEMVDIVLALNGPKDAG